MFPPSPSVQASNDTVVCLGHTVQLHAEGGDSFLWSPVDFLSCSDCQDPVTAPNSAITYVVTAEDSNGCSAGTDSVRVEVSEACSYFVVPTAFSPNNDGKNDLFHVLSKNVVSFDMKILNRWGQIVFTSQNPDSTWDGRFNGKAAPVGSYVWHLNASLNDGTEIVRNGNVTLVR